MTIREVQHRLTEYHDVPGGPVGVYGRAVVIIGLSAARMDAYMRMFYGCHVRLESAKHEPLFFSVSHHPGAWVCVVRVLEPELERDSGWSFRKLPVVHALRLIPSPSTCGVGFCARGRLLGSVDAVWEGGPGVAVQEAGGDALEYAAG